MDSSCISGCISGCIGSQLCQLFLKHEKSPPETMKEWSPADFFSLLYRIDFEKGQKTDIANKLLRKIGKPVFFFYLKSGRRESDGWTDPGYYR
jgi:hypothetical protein